MRQNEIDFRMELLRRLSHIEDQLATMTGIHEKLADQVYRQNTLIDEIMKDMDLGDSWWREGGEPPDWE